MSSPQPSRASRAVQRRRRIAARPAAAEWDVPDSNLAPGAAGAPPSVGTVLEARLSSPAVRRARAIHRTRQPHVCSTDVRMARAILRTRRPHDTCFVFIVTLSVTRAASYAAQKHFIPIGLRLVPRRGSPSSGGAWRGGVWPPS